MTNAKEEMLELLKGKEIKCAEVTIGTDWDEEDEPRTIVLKVDYTAEGYERFLKELDFNYDSVFGQELYGTVWFKDKTWAGRAEYDGSVWWEEYSFPEIPKELLPY